MNYFPLKSGDTRPILEARLRNPDESVHDLTGATGVTLHVELPDGTVFSRPMEIVLPETSGLVRYVWTAADWAGAPPALPTLLGRGKIDLPMEYEVVGGSSTLTFPNWGTDTLRIVGAIA